MSKTEIFYTPNYFSLCKKSKDELAREILNRIDSEKRIFDEKKQLEAEKAELLEALKRLNKEMRICMTGYRKAVNTVPGNDIGQSVLFEGFNEAQELAKQAIAKAEGK